MDGNLKIPFDKILMDTVTDMVFVVNVKNNRSFFYHFINKAMTIETGLSTEVINKPIENFLDKDVMNMIKARFKRVIKERKSLVFRDRYVLNNQEVRYSRTKMTPFYDDYNRCIYIATVASDITSEVLSERKYKDSDYHFQIIAKNMQDLITLIDKRGIIIYTSPSYETVLGHDHEEYVGKHFLYKVYEPDRPNVDKAFNESLRSNEKFNIRFRQYNDEGMLKWSESHGTPVFDRHGNLKHIVVVTRDISRQIAHEKELQYYALHDSQTGVPNRRYFQQYLEKTLGDLQHNDLKVAVIIFDIDNFKQINDEYGHNIGDDVIVEFSKRIKNHLGSDGMVARFGGDEFVVVLPEINEANEVFKLVEKIKDSITLPWMVSSNLLTVTSSIGVAITSDEKDTPLTMIKKADLALYEAKNAGKNTYKIAK